MKTKPSANTWTENALVKIKVDGDLTVTVTIPERRLKALLQRYSASAKATQAKLKEKISK
jgi:hypothetical protein